MINYIIRRLVVAALTLFFITFLIYGLLRNIPGSPITTLNLAEMDSSKGISKEDYARLEKAYRLDKPWYVAYFYWFSDAVQSDLGDSFQDKTPVWPILREKMASTLLLSVTSLVLAYLSSIPLGLYAAARSGEWDERILSVGLFMMYSIPSMVAALLLLIVFYVNLQDTVFYIPLNPENDFEDLSLWGQTLDVGRRMILPVLCYSYAAIAYLSRFVKSNMEEVVRQDYIRTARAKGVSETTILLSHAFRNTLIPFVTMIGLSLPALVSGSIILEQIFGWDGMGRQFLTSLQFRDYPMIMAITLAYTVLTLLGQLLADLLYAFVDPRITYS